MVVLSCYQAAVDLGECCISRVFWSFVAQEDTKAERLSFGANTGQENSGGNIRQTPMVTAMDLFKLSIVPEACMWCSRDFTSE